MVMDNRSLLVFVVLCGFSMGLIQASIAEAAPSADTGMTTASVSQTTVTMAPTPLPRRRGGLIPASERSPEDRERLRQFQERINRQAEAIKRGEKVVDHSTTTTKPIQAPIPADLVLPGAEVAPLSR